MSILRLTFPLAALRPSALARLAARLLAAKTLARSRRRLGCLDDHILRDIGLTRDQAESEAQRSIWDAPLHWKG